MEIAAFVLSLIAIGIAAVAAPQSKRSADAAVEATGYQRAEVERNRVVFRLDPVGNNTHLLRNDGTQSAFGVHVDVGDLIVHGATTDTDEFPADHAEEYLFLFHAEATTTHMTVTWHQEADRPDQERVTRLYVER